MSRRIAYLIVIAACAAFAAPVAADPECFGNTCRMPEVIEAPETPAGALEEPNVVDAVPPAERRMSAPASIRPKMSDDARPALRPAPHRQAEEAPDKPVLQVVRRPRQANATSEPIEVANRHYSAPEQPQAYASNRYPSQPGAGVIVVVPGLQYGEDGVALLQGRQDASWELCQSDRRGHGRCGPYNYQPYGAPGYRPLGSYRPYRAAPTYVHVPDARILTLDAAD